MVSIKSEQVVKKYNSKELTKKNIKMVQHVIKGWVEMIQCWLYHQ